MPIPEPIKKGCFDWGSTAHVPTTLTSSWTSVVASEESLVLQRKIQMRPPVKRGWWDAGLAAPYRNTLQHPSLEGVSPFLDTWKASWHSLTTSTEVTVPTVFWPSLRHHFHHWPCTCPLQQPHTCVPHAMLQNNWKVKAAFMLLKPFPLQACQACCLCGHGFQSLPNVLGDAGLQGWRQCVPEFPLGKMEGCCLPLGVLRGLTELAYF